MFTSTLLWSFLLTLRLVASFQNEYKINTESTEIVRYNRSIVRDPKVTLFFYNKTTRAFNISGHLKQDIGSDLQVNLTLYKFINKQYRFYPFNFNANPCTLLQFNSFGILDVARLYNITKCPIPSGYYKLYNIIPDSSRFPPHLLPFGKYKACFSSYILGGLVMDYCWRGGVIETEHL